MKNPSIIYDGARYCGHCPCGCPQIEHSAEEGIVRISDPAKPENGSFTMSVAEYNALIKNAPPIGS